MTLKLSVATPALDVFPELSQERLAKTTGGATYVYDSGQRPWYSYTNKPPYGYYGNYMGGGVNGGGTNPSRLP
jgi:hypothetical protein